MIRVTLAFSTHRPEVLAQARAAAWGHHAVLLEEPPTPGFTAMLAGELDVDEYLLNVDYEFPAFARASCLLWRELHAQGAAIAQVGPFLEALVGIHERFAAGESPDDIAPGSFERVVYEAERGWSAALLGYYAASADPNFERVVHAVQNFARADAARGRLRDSLRAQAIAGLIAENPKWTRVYIEAGYIHHFLLPRLRRAIPKAEVSPVWLMERAARFLAGIRQVLNPGDKLTFLYTCRPDAHGPRPDLLAARALVHVKIERKQEYGQRFMGGRVDPWPHTRDEAACSALASRLSFDQCRELFARIRRLPTSEARAEAEAFAAAM